MATNDLMARALRFCVEHGYCEGLTSDIDGPTMILSCSDCHVRIELQVLDFTELLHFLAVIKNDDLFHQAVADAKRRATM
jgi:hypothetical protein